MISQPHITGLQRPGAKVTLDKPVMDFGAAVRLDVFANYRFFTPALLYLYGGFTDEALVQFLTEYNKPVVFYHHLFQRPIFCGMNAPGGDVRWNHALWAVEKQYWPVLENYLLSVAYVDRAGGTIYRIGAQDLTILDPLRADNSPSLFSDVPTLDIVSLGVDSSRGVVALEVSTDVLSVPPTIRVYKPRDPVVRFAKHIFKDDPLAALNETAPAYPGPLPTAPLDFRTQSIDTLSPERQAEMLKLVAEYKKENP